MRGCILIEDAMTVKKSKARQPLGKDLQRRDAMGEWKVWGDSESPRILIRTEVGVIFV